MLKINCAEFADNSFHDAGDYVISEGEVFYKEEKGEKKNRFSERGEGRSNDLTLAKNRRAACVGGKFLSIYRQLVFVSGEITYYRLD